MSEKKKRSLAIPVTAVVVAGAIIMAVYGAGQHMLGKMLQRDAMLAAEVWAQALPGGNPRDLGEALAQGEGRGVARALEIAPIVAVVVVAAEAEPVVLSGSRNAAADLRRVVSGARGTNRAVWSAGSGVYSVDHVSWLGQRPYHSWVLFPAPGAGDERLALRLDQTQTAIELTRSFAREVLFSGGVAAITFASFMAGFSYRQRQLAAENAAIRYLALHDELTGLPNRKQFEEFLTESIATAQREGHKTALFILDLDGFKAVNDTLGHPVGDGLLKAAAKRLKASLRGGDLLARLSGDEFAVVVPKVVDPSMLAPIAERVLKLISGPFRVEGHEVQVGCSIGLAVAPDNGADIASLIRNADFALYRAKSEGRRTWRFFDPKMAEDLASRQTLEDGLRHALENDHFQLLYQPQVELATGRTVGYEAMLRWRLPGKGLVPASVFVSIADETGLVVPIGEWVIRQVARDCALIPADCKVAINLSATQLKRDGIETFIAETLKSHRVPPNRIEIEVNETLLGRNESLAFSRLQQIRDSGVSIVMDSFGAGTLSLGLLSRYAFDKIKVDRSFLMSDEQKGGAVLAAICSLGRSLGFRVAGQGVETIEHAQLLRAAGCSEAQGYYFAAPMPLEQILRLAEERDRPKLQAIA